MMPIRRFLAGPLPVFILAGCATTPMTESPGHEIPTAALTAETPVSESPGRTVPAAALTAEKPVSAPIRQIAAEETGTPASTSSSHARPAYGQLEAFPIDLPTVIRLTDESSPTIGIARARIREAEARVDAARAQWLPNLSIGSAYLRYDGQTQNQRGEVFGVSRANLFSGGGPALNLDTAEAIFAPLIARRLSAAEQFRTTAVVNLSELEAVTAYLDLVQAHAQLAINADTLSRAEAMLTAAQNAKDANLDRTPGDVNRSQSEVLYRRVERIELEGRIGTTSAKLGRLLLLPPTVRLVPADENVVPVPLVDPNATLDQLVSLAISNRPELAANRELIAAAWAQVRKQQRGPLLPKVAAANMVGSFGGGLNDDLQNFDARNALSVQLYWEVKNLGFGNRAAVRERRAMLDQAHLQQVDAQARVAAEIVESAQVAAARYESLDMAERSVKEALELYRISKEGTFNVLDAKNLFDALRPLQSIQLLNQARTSYLSAVVDFNRAQYRLYTALGNSPRCGVAGPRTPGS